MAFEKGNKYAQEWTLENALPRFEDALAFAENDKDCLCLQDAKYVSGIPSSTFDYLVDNHDVLCLIKKDIMDHIISRVNKLAMRNLAPASPAIWRMKQLGERDEQHINQTGTQTQNVVVIDQKTADDLERLRNKFENE